MRGGNGDCIAEPVRAFLALPVLPPALGPFQALGERLMAEVGAVRWAPFESPHITLHFFGALSDAAAVRALDALRPALAAQTSMSLRLHRLGGFPSDRRPRVLWCGVDGDVDALRAVASDCAIALRSARFAVDDRPYRAHCTVGRPRQPWPAEALRAWLAVARDEPRTPMFTSDCAILYESVGGPGGVCHVPRATVALGMGPSSAPVGDDPSAPRDP